MTAAEPSGVDDDAASDENVERKEGSDGMWFAMLLGE